MKVNICVGKFGQKDFPEIGQIEIEDMENFTYNKEVDIIVQKYLKELNDKDKVKMPWINGYQIRRTILVPKDNNLFVWIG